MTNGKYQDWLTDEGLLQLEAKKHPDISDTLKRGKAVVDIPAIDLGVLRTYRFNDTGNWIDEEIRKDGCYNG